MLLLRRYAVLGLAALGLILAAVALPGSPRTVSAAGYLGDVGYSDSVTVTGQGYAPGAEITLTFESTPVFLKVVTADANGSFTASVTIPAGVPYGNHDIVASGKDPSGNQLVQKTLVNVKQAQPKAQAVTPPKKIVADSSGFNATPVVIFVAVVLLLGGTILVLWRQRRQSTAGI